MTAQEWSKKYGKKAVREMCAKVGVSLVYWRNVKNQHSSVSTARALEFARASDEVSGGDPMTVVSLLRLDDLPARIVGSVRGDK
jgi:hypothetical protein